MNLTRNYIAICAILAMATVQAQTQSQSKNNVPVQGQSQIFFRADKLVGQSAQTTVGQNLGKINEIVFNPEKGIYGIVQAENDRLVALPWTLVTAVTDKAVVFKTSQQEFAGAPSFANDQWTRLNEPQFTQQIDSHFQQGATGGSSGQGTQGASTGMGSSTNAPAGGSSSLESTTSTNSPSATGSDSSTNSPSAGQ